MLICSRLYLRHFYVQLNVNFAKILSNSWEAAVQIFDNKQASAYEKQGRAKTARLVTTFRGYRCVKSRTPPTK